jgi:Nucleotide modification associated domain 2
MLVLNAVHRSAGVRGLQSRAVIDAESILGFCTLAVCTQNHQGTKLDVGNWIAGFLEKNQGRKFLYPMEISEILGSDEYFRDPHFTAKKPNLHGYWKERCGDNFYSRGVDGTWLQHSTRFHLDERDEKARNKACARVFIGERFWYRGRSAVMSDGV